MLIGARELYPVVYAHHLLRLVRLKRFDPATLRCGKVHEIREIIFTLGVLLPDTPYVLMEEPGSSEVYAGVHLCYPFLQGAAVLVLDYPRDPAAVVPYDPAVAVGVVHYSGDKGKGGLLPASPVKPYEGRQGLLPYKWHVPGKDEHVAIKALKLFQGAHYGVAGAELLGLLHKDQSFSLECLFDIVRAVAYDHQHPAHLHLFKKPYGIKEHRMARYPVQDLRHIRFHPRTLASGKDYSCEIPHRFKDI